MENDQLEQLVYRTLRAQKAVWTPQCLTPETLLKCLDLKEAYPPEAADLSHFIRCAYCRRQAVELCEIRRLASPPPAEAGEVAQSSDTPLTADPLRLKDVLLLPTGTRAWANDLIVNGLLAPIEALRAYFEYLQRLMAPPAPERTRSAAVLHDLHPTLTAVRSTQPVLRWKGGETAQAVEVAIARPGERPWRGRARADAPFTVPGEAGLEPGGIYRWRVTLDDQNDYYAAEDDSSQSSFFVLSETLAQEVAALEQEAGDSLLARISIYEAHGLYDEALQTLEKTLENLPPAERDEATTRFYDKLLLRLKAEAR